jgi:hypothetical protein
VVRPGTYEVEHYGHRILTNQSPTQIYARLQLREDFELPPIA